MMKQKKAESLFYRNYHKEVKATVNMIQSSASSAHIHRLRVHIKTINTFLLLFDEAAPGQLKINKFRNYFHQLFKVAGKVRGIQVNHALAGHSEASASEKNAYKIHSRKKIKRAKKNLNKTLRIFDHKFIQKADRRVKALCATLGNNYILLQSKQFILREINHIESIPEKHGDDGFHELRKHLKAIYAVSSMLNSIHNNRLLKKKLERLREMEQRIGKWHDRMLFDISWSQVQEKDLLKSSHPMTLSQHLRNSNTGTKKSIQAFLHDIFQHLPE